MELHENLYALGLRLGREVFEDPDSFRGALDDFLDEESATTGDINLLVDAVRLGAFVSMTSMLGSGAQVTAAVEEAGSRLARDRGSADVAGAQWACAVLGFAIGKVSDAEVRRYRTQHATPQPPSQPLPPTQFPQQPQRPQSPAPPTQYPGAPGAGAPPGTGPLPTAQPMYAPSSAPPQQSWPGGPGYPPEPKRKAWPLIVATVAAIALIAGGIVALIVTRDDGDPVRSGNGGNGETSESVDDVSTDIEAVAERYGGLAGDIDSGVDECEAADASDGTTEELTCTFADGTLELTTYETTEDLEANRAATVTTNPGTVFSDDGPGTLYAEDAGSAVGQAETSSLYWDNTDALQSGRFVASSETDSFEQFDDVKEQFAAVAPPVAFPDAPEDEALVALAEEFIKLGKCNRIPTIQAGEVEESICTAPKGIFIFMGAFETNQDFRNYRRQALDQGSEQGYTLTNWNFGGGAREGAAAEYVTSSGTAVRYWDQDDCKCYMEAHLDSGDLKVVENWWINA